MNQSISNQNLPGQHGLTGWIFVGFLCSVLLVVGFLRGQGMMTPQDDAPVSWKRSLRFEDRADGGISVIDGQSAELLTTVHGEQGFLRGAVRTLARERRSRQLGPEQPFQLIARADGRLTLFDPATGQRVELEAFGPSNAGVFSPFLAMKPAN
jgi:putative photosynthetic complex assembly protein